MYIYAYIYVYIALQQLVSALPGVTKATKHIFISST